MPKKIHSNFNKELIDDQILKWIMIIEAELKQLLHAVNHQMAWLKEPGKLLLDWHAPTSPRNKLAVRVLALCHTTRNTYAQSSPWPSWSQAYLAPTPVHC